jgi:hypothetical protein
MSEPYRVVGQGTGCPTCQHDEQYDIVGPDESAQSQSWADVDEAEYICSLMNVAYAHGRVSYGEEVLQKLKDEVNQRKGVANAQSQTEAVSEAPKPFNTKTLEGEDIPF